MTPVPDALGFSVCDYVFGMHVIFAALHKLRGLWRYTRFCLIGAVGVGVDMAMIFLLADRRMLGLNLTLSKIVAAEIAMCGNFIGNELWTFRDCVVDADKQSRCVARLCKFNLICVAGIAISVLLLNAQVLWFNINVYIANFVSIVIVSFWNYGMNLKYGWCSPRINTSECRLR